jgi:hypothetical protein
MFRTKDVQKIKTLFCSTFFFFFENRALYEIMWKNIVKPGTPQMKIWYLRIACWIPKAINTHREYVMLIAFPQQQWLHQRTCNVSLIRTLPVLCKYVNFCSFVDKAFTALLG